MRCRPILTIALAVLVGGAQAAAAQTPIDADTVGAPRSNARAELFLPAGSGPFPAMAVLHGFDAKTPPRMYAGHYVGRNPEAAEDAVAATRNSSPHG